MSAPSTSPVRRDVTDALSAAQFYLQATTIPNNLTLARLMAERAARLMQQVCSEASMGGAA